VPNVSDLFPSKYLSCADLADEEAVFTIKKVEPYKTQEGDPKLIITFSEPVKPLMANQTNTRTIAKVYGDDTDDWIGKRITLYPTEVQFKKDMVEAIRIRSKPPKPLAKNGAPKKPVPVTQEEADNFGDDDVPY
jgi:hypothetical protein